MGPDAVSFLLSEASAKAGEPTGGSVFPLLAPQTLAAFDRLDTPLHIFCFERERIAWANPPALKIWNATSLGELQSRPLAPFSEATRVRLAGNLAAFQRGEILHESWVFYPMQIATPTQCRQSGVSLADAPHCMLVEHLMPTASVPLEDLRSIEALRHSPLMISLHKLSGEPLMRNPAALDRFSSLAPGALPVSDTFGAMFADPELADRLLAQAMALGQAASIAEMTCPGRPMHRVGVASVTDPVTGDPAILVHQQDMTELRAARVELDASEQAVSFALRFNDSPVLILSATSGALIRTNPAADRLLTEASRRDLSRLFVDPNDLDMLRSDLTAGRGATWQVQLYRPDGRVFWASLTGQRLIQPDADVLALIVTAIAGQPAGDPSVEGPAAFERAIEAMHAKLLAVASHEFRTPLAIIDSAAQRLQKKANRLEQDGTGFDPIATAEAIRSRSGQIRDTVQRLLRTIESALDQAKPELQRPAIALEPTELVGFIKAVILRYSESQPHEAFTLIGSAPVVARINPYLFDQVLTNLFDNARKYSAGPTAVKVMLNSDEDDVVIDVVDNGIGIPKADRGHIFEEFRRASNVGSRPGSGLGLSIVRYIMTQLIGSIELVDTDGPGSTFRLRLPLIETS